MKIFGFDFGKLLRPKIGHTVISRTEAQQREVEREAAKLALYHSPSCLYCLMTRRAIGRLAINIKLMNISSDPDALRELINGGGRPTVPCLRIDNEEGQRRWMYESRDIIAYLEQRFSFDEAPGLASGATEA